MKTSKTFSIIIWPIIYVALVIGICILGCVSFNNYYYSGIYVNGDSMYPTLHGVHASDPESYGYYGKVQNDKNAIKNLKRFQIVNAYYPSDEPNIKTGKAVPKIKRVIFLPGETFEVINNDLFVYENDSVRKIEINYERNLTSKHSYPKTTLKDDEYFLSGDNWENSSDSFDSGIGPIKLSLMKGIVISMVGECKIKDNNCYDMKPFADGTKYYPGVDY